MRIFVCSVEELKDAASFDAASLIVDPVRKKKLSQIRCPADIRRSMGAGLLLAYAFDRYQKQPEDYFSQSPGDKRIEEVLVSELLSVPEQRFLYREASGGKPYLEGESGFYFSLSHSGDYALCACAPFEIGADLQITDREAGDNLARRVMTQREYDFYKGLSEAGKKQEFYRVFSCKESCCKLTGRGLAQGFQNMETDPQRKRILMNEISSVETVSSRRLFIACESFLWKENYRIAVSYPEMEGKEWESE